MTKFAAWRAHWAAGFIAVAGALCSTAAVADPVGDFYKGKELQDLTERLFKTSPEAIARMRQLLGTKVPERSQK